MDKYFDKVKHIIAAKAGIEPEDITPESYFEDDLNIGEFELNEIVSDIEEVYQIDLSEEKESFETVQNLVDAVIEKLE